jgi:hypothetical protein
MVQMGADEFVVRLPRRRPSEGGWFVVGMSERSADPADPQDWMLVSGVIRYLLFVGS